MNAKETALWLCLAWLWGSSFLAIGIAVETFSPVDVVAGRMGIGAAFLILILLLGKGSLRMGWRAWLIATVVGLSGNVLPFLLISFAEQRVDSGLAALIMGIAPVVTLVIAPLVHHEETLGRRKIVGALIGFCGIGVLVGPNAFEDMGYETLAQIALLGAAFCYAFTALFSRRFPHEKPMQTAAASVLIGAVVIGIISITNWQEQTASASSLLAIVYLGIGPTALAAAIYFYLIPRIGAGRLQQVNYVVPVLGTLLGIFVLHEQPTLNTWIAIPFILAAVYIVTRKA